jgi:putative transposase
MRSYNVKLFFDKSEDQDRFLQTLSVQTQCWNFVSEMFFANRPTDVKALHDLVYRPSRDKFPDLPAQYVIRSYNDVKAAYRAAKSNGHEISRAFSKDKPSVRLDKHLYSWKGDAIRITSMGGKKVRLNFSPYPRLRKAMNQCVPCDPLVFMRDGQLWLSISFDENEPPVVQNKVLGVDVGMKRLYATSEGDLFIDRKYLKDKRRLRYLKRQLNSRGTASARRHSRKVGRKESNRSKAQTHKAVNRLLQTECNVIAVEDLSKLKSKKFSQNKKKGDFGSKQNNKLSQVPMYMFKEVLKYKAALAGKQVVEVSPFLTSQKDYRGLKKGVRKKIRYHASDGMVFDADVNAAINIAQKWARRNELPVSFVPPIDGRFGPLGQAAVNRPIVCQSLF